MSCASDDTNAFFVWCASDDTNAFFVRCASDDTYAFGCCGKSIHNG